MVVASVAQTDSRIKPRHTIPDVPRRATLQTIADVRRRVALDGLQRLQPARPAGLRAARADPRRRGGARLHRRRTPRPGGCAPVAAASSGCCSPRRSRTRSPIRRAVGFLEGLAREAEAGGTALLLVPSPPGADAAARRARGGRRRSLHLLDGRRPARASAPRSSAGCRPSSSRSPTSPGQAFVGIDDRSATREVAEHVLGLGHRRVAVLTDRLRAGRLRGPGRPGAGGGARRSTSGASGSRVPRRARRRRHRLGDRARRTSGRTTCEAGVDAGRAALAATPAPDGDAGRDGPARARRAPRSRRARDRRAGRPVGDRLRRRARRPRSRT